MINLDEIIKSEEEIAKVHQKVIDTGTVYDDVTIDMLFGDDTDAIGEALEKHKIMVDYHSAIANIIRKYQKIKQIVDKWNEGIYDDEGLSHTEVMELVSDEVYEDGNDN